jgi:hypothetical protein
VLDGPHGDYNPISPLCALPSVEPLLDLAFINRTPGVDPDAASPSFGR